MAELKRQLEIRINTSLFNAPVSIGLEKARTDLGQRQFLSAEHGLNISVTRKRAQQRIERCNNDRDR